jgi:hypothetical protein
MPLLHSGPFHSLSPSFRRFGVSRFLTFSLRHATLAQWVILLPATVSLFWDPQYPRVLSFGFWRRPAARFRSLRRFLSPPTGSTAASPLGTS